MNTYKSWKPFKKIYIILPYFTLSRLAPSTSLCCTTSGWFPKSWPLRKPPCFTWRWFQECFAIRPLIQPVNPAQTTQICTNCEVGQKHSETIKPRSHRQLVMKCHEWFWMLLDSTCSRLGFPGIDIFDHCVVPVPRPNNSQLWLQTWHQSQPSRHVRLTWARMISIDENTINRLIWPRTVIWMLTCVITWAHHLCQSRQVTVILFLQPVKLFLETLTP